MITYATLDFPYQTEALRPALILIGLCAAIGLVAPALRPFALIIAVGPLVWAALQLIRRGRGITVDAAAQTVVLRRALFRGVQIVAFNELRGAIVTPSGGVLIAAVVHITPGVNRRMQVAPSAYGPALSALPTAQTTGQTTLQTQGQNGTAADSVPTIRRHRIYLTAVLQRAPDLASLLQTALQAHVPAQDQLPAQRLQRWARRRKIRDYAMIVLLICGLPIYVYLISGLFRGFM